MQIINTLLGRVVLEINSDEFRPMSNFYVPELVKLLAEKYNFVSLPQELTNQTSLNFQKGYIILSKNRKINIQNIQIFNDALVVETTHTDDSESVLEDMMAWLIKVLKFRSTKMPIKKLYESHVIIDLDKSVNSALKVFDNMNKSISKAFSTIYGYKLPVDLVSFTMADDSLSRPSGLCSIFKGEFSITRRVGVPFTQNRFVCVATLPTVKHLELLENFERDLLANC